MRKGREVSARKTVRPPAAGNAGLAARRPPRAAGSLFAAALVLLAGCNTTGVPIQTATVSRMVTPEEAFAIPPPGGPAVMTILERAYANAVEQELIFPSMSGRPGQNFMLIQLFGRPVIRSASHATLDNTLPDMTGIWLEMDEYLVGVGMVVSPYYVENRYGPFGYAMGRYADDLCIYAWQRLGEADLNARDNSNKAAIGIRLRLCRTGATERQLLQVMYDFTLTAYYADGRWNPYVDNAALGGGVPIYPPQDLLQAQSAAPAPAPAAPAAPAITPIGPVVPLPPTAGEPTTVVPPPPG